MSPSKSNMYLTDVTDDDSSTTELQVKSLIAVSELEIGLCIVTMVTVLITCLPDNFR